MTEKSREQKLRRAADRKGLTAVNGKRPFENYGSGWMILRNNNNLAIAGVYPFTYSLSLEEAEEFVKGYCKE